MVAVSGELPFKEPKLEDPVAADPVEVGWVVCRFWLRGAGGLVSGVWSCDCCSEVIAVLGLG